MCGGVVCPASCHVRGCVLSCVGVPVWLVARAWPVAEAGVEVGGGGGRGPRRDAEIRGGRDYKCLGTLCRAVVEVVVFVVLRLAVRVWAMFGSCFVLVRPECCLLQARSRSDHSAESESGQRRQRKCKQGVRSPGHPWYTTPQPPPEARAHRPCNKQSSLSPSAAHLIHQAQAQTHPCDNSNTASTSSPLSCSPAALLQSNPDSRRLSSHQPLPASAHSCLLVHDDNLDILPALHRLERRLALAEWEALRDQGLEVDSAAA